MLKIQRKDTEKKSMEILIIGQWDGSAGKGACHQVQQPAFKPRDHIEGRINFIRLFSGLYQCAMACASSTQNK